MHFSRLTGGILSTLAVPDRVDSIPALPRDGRTTLSSVLGFRTQNTIARSPSIPTIGERCRDGDARKSLVDQDVTTNREHAGQNIGLI